MTKHEMMDASLFTDASVKKGVDPNRI
jgi:hypothetical protein